MPARAVLVDVGGVLLTHALPRTVAVWAPRLACPPESLLAAVFGCGDDLVLVGRMSEAHWWDVVARRLGVDAATAADLRRDMESAGDWDDGLLRCLRKIRGVAMTGVVANAWPHLRARLAEDGIEDLLDEVVLSCEAGYAKPDPRVFTLTLERLGVAPGEALFIDDMAENVGAAEKAGMSGHLHRSSAATVSRIQRFVQAGYGQAGP